LGLLANKSALYFKTAVKFPTEVTQREFPYRYVSEFAVGMVQVLAFTLNTCPTGQSLHLFYLTFQ